MESYEYEVQGRYSARHGWECVTTESTRQEALAMAQTYRENEPGVPFRVKRVKIETT